MFQYLDKVFQDNPNPIFNYLNQFFRHQHFHPAHITHTHAMQAFGHPTPNHYHSQFNQPHRHAYHHQSHNHFGGYAQSAYGSGNYSFQSPYTTLGRYDITNTGLYRHQVQQFAAGAYAPAPPTIIAA